MKTTFTSEPAPPGTSWSERREAARGRHAARYDEAAAGDYQATPGLGTVGPNDVAAYAADLRRAVTFAAGMRVLDAGAGTGALCSILRRWPGLSLTALEPSAAMLARLRAQPDLADVETVQGSCDAPGDALLFPPSRFDVIASRQVANGLFDPLAAFRHWHRWLKAGGHVVVIDGLYGRDAWCGDWAEEIDVLPLAACQSMATVPYLLEQAGFEVTAVQALAAVNALPTTRTPRYVAVARR